MRLGDKQGPNWRQAQEAPCFSLEKISRCHIYERTSRSAVAQSRSNILHRSAQTGSLALEEPKPGKIWAPAFTSLNAKTLQLLNGWVSADLSHQHRHGESLQQSRSILKAIFDSRWQMLHRCILGKVWKEQTEVFCRSIEKHSWVWSGSWLGIALTCYITTANILTKTRTGRTFCWYKMLLDNRVSVVAI